jgi:hypothetical protein
MPALGPINHKRAPAEDPAISSTMEKLRVEYWPIQRLKPYDRNPRKNDKAVTRIAVLESDGRTFERIRAERGNSRA